MYNRSEDLILGKIFVVLSDTTSDLFFDGSRQFTLSLIRTLANYWSDVLSINVRELKTKGVVEGPLDRR